MPCSHLPPADQPDPLRVDDAHLTETVLLLARGIAADLGFDRLPILADALEDAACDNLTLLNHLRSGDGHVTECWALRRLLRTTLMLPGDVPMAFAYCPPGTFTMSSETQNTAYDERPVRRVTLTRGFYAGIHPVTQGQWRAVTGKEPSQFAGVTRPVERVDWQQALDFCRQASRATGRGVRLPTEAEWEYACRAGTTTEYHWGDAATAADMNYNWQTSPVIPRPASTGESTPVGRYPPNPWGLYDCHGNVWEWCQDCYVPMYYAVAPATDPVCVRSDNGQRVIRGGSFDNYPNLCRSASRYGMSADSRSSRVGLRVVFTA